MKQNILMLEEHSANEKVDLLKVRYKLVTNYISPKELLSIFPSFPIVKASFVYLICTPIFLKFDLHCLFFSCPGYNDYNDYNDHRDSDLNLDLVWERFSELVT